MARRPISRSALRLLAVTATLALSVTACGGGGGGGSAEEANSARGPITIWYSNNEAELKWGKAMVEEWNAAHPDEQVEGQEIPAGKSSEEVIGAAITAGTAPCLVFNTAPSAVGQWQRQGGLVNLNDFEGGQAYIEERSGEVAQQYLAPDGSGFYQLPWKSNPVMIFYNKDLFTKAGLDPEQPKLSTYADFLATAQKLKDSKAAQYAIWPAPTSEFFQSQFDFLPLYAAQSGGKGLVADNQATFGDENGIAVFDFWKSLYSAGLASKEVYTGDAFADEKAAMSIVGPWAVAVYDKVNWGSVPVPTKDGMPAESIYTFSDAKNIGLFTACQNRATAFDVLKFATSEDQDGKLLETTGQMPLRKDLQTVYADYFTENPAYQQFGDQASRTVEVPGGPHTVEMLQTIRDAYTRSVISGEGDVPTAVQGAADKVTELAQQQ